MVWGGISRIFISWRVEQWRGAVPGWDPRCLRQTLRWCCWPRVHSDGW
jgi:hypothetical protein